jgi:hypothetical protein
MIIFFRKKESGQDEAIGFEPEEQKTPWLGRILLIILAGVLLLFGWVGLSDLGRIPSEPEKLSECIGFYGKRRINKKDVLKYHSYRLQYTEYYDVETKTYKLKTCTFSSYEKKVGVPEAYYEAQKAWQDKDNYERFILQPLENQLYQIDTAISQKQKEYDISLQELQAGQPPVGKTPEQLRIELRDLQNQKQQITLKLGQARSEWQSKDNIFREKEAILIDKIGQAIDLYNRAWAGYKFQVFLLEMLFTLPFFALSVWFYFRLMRKNSPHTIILLPIVFSSAILLARNILLYFWAWFLADLIEIILNLSGTLAILRVLLFYLGMLLAILIFGGAVYLLQRKIFAPARVRLRRLKSKKCAYCETPLDFTKNFCAGCGSPLLQKCPNCGQDRFIDFKFCPYCGK